MYSISPRSFAKFTFAAPFTALLTACGGGGAGDDKSPPPPSSTTAPVSSIALSGQVVVSKPQPHATVTVQCAAGLPTPVTAGALAPNATNDDSVCLPKSK